MTQARYDAVADFYATGFDSADDPATRGLLDLLGPVDGQGKRGERAARPALSPR